MTDDLDEIEVENASRKCPYCGAKAASGVHFCVMCGNLLESKLTVRDWRPVASKPDRTRRPCGIQVAVWLLVVAVALFGAYAYFGGRVLHPLVRGDSAEVNADDVEMAVGRLKALQKSIEDEDARKLAAEREAKQLFRRQAEEAKALEREFRQKGGDR